MNEPTENNILRLPLWRECVKHMQAQGVSHGQAFSAQFFEDELRCKRDSMAFALSISEIRRALEEDGFYLTGRGQNGEQYVVVPAAANADIMKMYGRKAADALRRGVILGTNTRLDLLGPEDRRRHEAVLEKMAIKCALLERSGAVMKALPAATKKLLIA